MEDKNTMEIIEKMKEWIKKYYPHGYDVYRDYNDRLSPDMILNDLEQKNFQCLPLCRYLWKKRKNEGFTSEVSIYHFVL